MHYNCVLSSEKDETSWNGTSAAPATRHAISVLPGRSDFPAPGQGRAFDWARREAS